MGVKWVIEGHFLQAMSLLLVIALIITLFMGLIHAFQRQPQEAEEQADETEHRKYTDDDFIGLD